MARLGHCGTPKLLRECKPAKVSEDLKHTETCVSTKLGGAGDRFGDFLRVDCADLQTHNGGSSQLTAHYTRSHLYPMAI